LYFSDYVFNLKELNISQGLFTTFNNSNLFGFFLVG